MASGRRAGSQTAVRMRYERLSDDVRRPSQTTSWRRRSVVGGGKSRDSRSSVGNDRIVADETVSLVSAPHIGVIDHVTIWLLTLQRDTLGTALMSRVWRGTAGRGVVVNVMEMIRVFQIHFRDIPCYVTDYTYAIRCGDRFVEKFTYLLLSRHTLIKLCDVAINLHSTKGWCSVDRNFINVTVVSFKNSWILLISFFRIYKVKYCFINTV